MDVNVAIKIEAWAVAEGLTVDTVGSVEARILRSLRGLAGIAGFGGLMHWNNEVIKLLQTIAESAGSGAVESVNGETGAVVLTAADIGVAPGYGVLTAAGVSAGTNYEVTGALEPDGPGCLQLLRVPNFPTARSLTTTPQYGWIQENLDKLSSANDTTTNANVRTLVFNTTNNQWFGGTGTSPWFYRTVTLEPNQQLELITRVASNAQRDFELVGPMVVGGSAAAFARIWMGYDSSLKLVPMESSTAGTTVAINSTQRDNGVWLRLVAGATGYRTYYNLTNQSAPPTSWTFLSGGAPAWLGLAASATLKYGVGAQSQNVTGGFTPKVLYHTARLSTSLPDQAVTWGNDLFATSGPEQLVGVYDFGTSTALNQTRLRQILADATNTRPLDSATVTWSVTSGASGTPASGTFYAANAMVVPAANVVVAVYVKITSATGVEQGSIRLPLLLPAA